MDNSSELLIEGNWVLHILSRHFFVEMVGDPIGGIIGCANRIEDTCINLRIRGNRVMGVEPVEKIDSVGFSVMPHECGDYEQKNFFDNVAHSISGQGANIFRNRTSA